jgi:serine protease inhibitor
MCSVGHRHPRVSELPAQYRDSRPCPLLGNPRFGSIKDGGIHLSLPRWTARTHLTLNETLARWAYRLRSERRRTSAAWSRAAASGSTGSEHEAVVEVDEDGTRAAAATGGRSLRHTDRQ